MGLGCVVGVLGCLLCGLVKRDMLKKSKVPPLYMQCIWHGVHAYVAHTSSCSVAR